MWMGYINISLGFPGGSDGKEPACRAGDMGSIPELGWYPGEGNGYPVQYSCLKNSMDRGAWWAKSRTRPSDWHTLTVRPLCFFGFGINITVWLPQYKLNHVLLYDDFSQPIKSSPPSYLTEELLWSLSILTILYLNNPLFVSTLQFLCTNTYSFLKQQYCFISVSCSR